MTDWRSVVLAIRAAAILFAVVEAEAGLRHIGWAAMMSSSGFASARFVTPEVTRGVLMLVLSGACVWALVRPHRVARWFARRITA